MRYKTYISIILIFFGSLVIAKEPNSQKNADGGGHKNNTRDKMYTGDKYPVSGETTIFERVKVGDKYFLFRGDYVPNLNDRIPYFSTQYTSGGSASDVRGDSAAQVMRDKLAHGSGQARNFSGGTKETVEKTSQYLESGISGERVWNRSFSDFDNDPELAREESFKKEVRNLIIHTANEQVKLDIAQNASRFEKDLSPIAFRQDFPDRLNEIQNISLPQRLTQTELTDSLIRSRAAWSFSEVTSTGWHVDDIAPYVSSRSDELQSLKDKFDTAAPKTPQQWLAKDVGVKALREADREFISSRFSADGEFYLTVAKNMLDIVTDFIPITSIPKDIFRLTTGMDLDGRELSSFERSLSLLSLATAGVVGEMRAITKATNRLAKVLEESRMISHLDELEKAGQVFLRHPNSITMVRQMEGAIAKLPKNLHPARISIGTNNKIAIVGRDMKYVETARDYLSKAHVVEIFQKDSRIIGSSAPEIEAAFQEWIQVKEQYARIGKLVPDTKIVETLLYKENKKWITAAKNAGYTIIDLGDPGNLEKERKSLFYLMELVEIFGAQR
ncbi:MAG TPA: pre-toxin TG domain-containing protein [Pseudobdellovibrionaceae bacterium]|nr:pre-toxin TG domain-containing protein [Pseudobdellovibrionaceae bacterium]